MQDQLLIQGEDRVLVMGNDVGMFAEQIIRRGNETDDVGLER